LGRGLGWVIPKVPANPAMLGFCDPYFTLSGRELSLCPEISDELAPVNGFKL